MYAAIGDKGSAEFVVTHDKTAKGLVEDGLPVFATPCLVGLMELAACNALHPHLRPEETSVGTGLDFTHTSATPEGMTVRARAEVTEVEGRFITFRVEAFDDEGPIGSGVHTRFVVDSERFMCKALSKKKDG